MSASAVTSHPASPGECVGRPMLLAAAFLAAGALVGSELGATAAAVLMTLAGLQLGLALMVRRATWAPVAVAAAATAVGAAAASVERLCYEAAPLLAWVRSGEGAGEPVELHGVLADDPLEDDTRWVLVMDVERVFVRGHDRPLRGRARIHVGGGAPRPELIEGDRVAAWAQLTIPRGFANPGGFDAPARMRRDGIHAVGHCKSARLVRIEGRGGVGALRDAASHSRRWARHRLKDLILPGDEEGVVRAMVLGDRTGIERETAEAFRIAGTYHVLAISGAQVALVAGILFLGFRAVPIPPGIRALVTCGAIVFYAAFVGGDVPVVRAAVTAVVMILGRAMDLDSDLANLLGVAGGLLLLGQPSAIHDLSFQLSFGATLGLLVFTAVVRAWLPRLPLGLDVALAASIAAQAVLTPLLVLHFNRLAPAALVLNLAAVPLSAAVLMTGLGVLVASLVGGAAASLAADVAWLAAHALLKSGEVVRLAPWLDLRVAAPSLGAAVVYVSGLIALSRGRYRRGVWVCVTGFAALVLGLPRSASDGRLHLSVLDVGHGDALVLRGPSGVTMVVDAGGAFSGRLDLGEAVVGPFLWSQGVKHIDRLVLTHAHSDHVGGAPFLLRAFAVGEVWEGPAPLMDPDYEALRPAMAGRERRSVWRGVHEAWDGVSIDVVWPPAPDRPPWKTRNDDSVVLQVRLGDVDFLLCADIERRAEDGLDAGPVEVLKVPHHGSRTSSGESFLVATSPRLAIVSVGARFGHPHPDVLARYARHGVRLYRTDRDGAITVSTDGRRIWVRTYTSGREERVR